MVSVCWDILYLLVSVTLVFLPLVIVIPDWLKLVPFYRKGIHGLNRMFELKEEREVESPDGSTKKKLKVGVVKKGEKGFAQVLEAIKSHRSVLGSEVTEVGLAFGDLPIKVTALSPNYAVFVAQGQNLNLIIYNPFDPNLLHLKELLSDWLKSRAQTRVAMSIFVVAVIWVTMMTLEKLGPLFLFT